MNALLDQNLTPASEFWTEEQCDRWILLSRQLLTIAFAALIAIEVLFRGAGGICGFASWPIMLGVGAHNIRRRVRRGETVPKWVETTPLDRKLAKFFEPVSLALLTAGAFWAAIIKVLPFLLHAHSIVFVVAAAYLEIIVAATVIGVYRAVALRRRALIANPLVNSAPQITLYQPVQTSEVDISSPSHWWTQSALREEAQPTQKVGR